VRGDRQNQIHQRLQDSRAALNEPMPPDCLRLQIWIGPSGEPDGAVAMTADRHDAMDLLAMMCRLRALSKQVEDEVLTRLADLGGIGIDSLRGAVEAGTAACGVGPAISRVTKRERS
jgi:hypothetical protein